MKFVEKYTKIRGRELHSIIDEMDIKRIQLLLNKSKELWRSMINLNDIHKKDVGDIIILIDCLFENYPFKKEQISHEVKNKIIKEYI